MKIKVDIERIAQGIYGLFTDEDMGPLAFGMLPADKMNALEQMLGEKFDKIVAEQIGASPDEATEIVKGFGVTLNIDKVRREFVNDIVRKVATRLYGIAKERGVLVV